MNKFPTQQAALKEAFTQVLGAVPTKGQVEISEEQRAKMGELMMGWLKEGLWSIKDGTRAAQFPLEYIVGKRPTDLIQAWIKPRHKKEPEAAPQQGRLEQIKAALDAGLIDAETAKELTMKFLVG